MRPDAGAPRLSSPVGRLLRTFSWQELRHHGLRHSTAVLAVLLGVALAFAVHLINASALSEFSAAVRSVNGQADLSLRAARGLLDETLYPQVAQRPEVAIANPVIELQTQARVVHTSTVSASSPTQTAPMSLRVLGLDPLVASPLTPLLVPRLATEVPGIDRLSLFAPESISLNAAAQRQLGVQAGDTIALQAGLRWVTLRVVGTVSAGGGPTGVMDLAGAQDTFGLHGQLSRLDVQLQGGAQPDALLRALALPPGVIADSADAATQRVSNVSRAYRVNLTVLALVALFTGAFLVFSILALSVAKRQQQFALLGVLGLSGRERLQLVLWESAAIGLLGSVLGLAVGTGLAATALKLLAGDLGGGYFPGIAPSLQWSPWAALLYGALGVIAAIVGGLLPARAAQQLAPAQALKGLGDAPSGRTQQWFGPLLLVVGVGLTQLPAVGGVPLFAYLAVMALLVGGIACVPGAVGAVLSLWPRAPLARHAALMLSVERARRMRHTATVAMAGVVASLSLSVALTVMVSSFRGSVTQWLDVVLPADLYARTAKSSSGAEAMHLDHRFLNAIAALPGVQRATGIRVSSLSLRPDQPAVALLARPIGEGTGDDAPGRSLPLVSDAIPARPGLVSIYVSEAMVDLYDARPGTTLQLPLQAGQPPVTAWVRAVWRDYARQQGAIVIGEADYQRLTGDTGLNDLALHLAPEARTADLQAAIRATAAAQGLDGALLEFAEPREIRQTTLRIFDRSFAVTYWLQAVAIGIGLFGVAASFSAQVLARRKEFGLLGHLGFTRRQILGIVAGEGAALTSVGALLGLALGIAVSMVLVHVVNPQSFHWTMDLLLPWPRLAALCASVVLAGTLTALLAGRAAVGRDAVLAVKEDW
ncbi:MAG: ABC transporter permease [Burkholderiales bacterium RIFCSPLOWO2_12_FULL_64_99]|nr:MAG: ABC transporter permease [Burkholderiales bacterium RIFCSPHIGHO2_12_FULL_63_20]OGB61643.1 MAG: ABC transporter permease [Burkholderiales bacterium RIFCSPLOWO2_12_FULL_64_99]